MIDVSQSEFRELATHHKLSHKVEQRIKDGGLKFFERPHPYFCVSDDQGQNVGVKVICLKYIQTFMLTQMKSLLERLTN
jgi:hypothetical protein